MDNIFVQGGLWMASATMLLLYFKRRRARQMSQD